MVCNVKTPQEKPATGEAKRLRGGSDRAVTRVSETQRSVRAVRHLHVGCSVAPDPDESRDVTERRGAEQVRDRTEVSHRRRNDALVSRLAPENHEAAGMRSATGGLVSRGRGPNSGGACCVAATHRVTRLVPRCYGRRTDARRKKHNQANKHGHSTAIVSLSEGRSKHALTGPQSSCKPGRYFHRKSCVTGGVVSSTKPAPSGGGRTPVSIRLCEGALKGKYASVASGPLTQRGEHCDAIQYRFSITICLSNYQVVLSDC